MTFFMVHCVEQFYKYYFPSPSVLLRTLQYMKDLTAEITDQIFWKFSHDVNRLKQQQIRTNNGADRSEAETDVIAATWWRV